MTNKGRCSWCFGRFEHNHTPQEVQAESGIRLMHKVCKAAWERERSLHWPARIVKPDPDEPREPS